MSACRAAMILSFWYRERSDAIARAPKAFWGAYAAAKAGVEGLALAAAATYAPKGIRVNCVAPGFVETDMVRRMDPRIVEEVVKVIPMRRLGQPEEVAKVVAFLASDLAGYITGVFLPVCGGNAMVAI